MTKFKALRKDFNNLKEWWSYLCGVIGSIKNPTNSKCEGTVPAPSFGVTELLDPFRTSDTWKVCPGDDGVAVKDPYKNVWKYYKLREMEFIKVIIESVNEYNDRVNEALEVSEEVRNQLMKFVPEGFELRTSIGVGNGNIDVYIKFDGFEKSFRYMSLNSSKDSINELSNQLKSEYDKRAEKQIRNDNFIKEFNALMNKYHAELWVRTYEEGTVYIDFGDGGDGKDLVLQEF